MPSPSGPARLFWTSSLVALLLVSTMAPARASRFSPGSGRGCSSAWAIVPSESLGRQTNVLEAVSAVSATDAWAVGYYAPGSITKPLIEHWDGTSFTVVTGAAITGRSMLHGVAAVSTDDVWAVGFAGSNVLIEHWDGTAWTRTATRANGTLSDVAAISSNDVWAVGWYGTKAITMHWDGSRWALVPVQLPDMFLPLLIGVSGVASNDVWAVGSYNDHGLQATLVVHWDGSSWTQVSSPNPPPPDSSNYLLSVDAVSANDVWAAGWYVGTTALGLVQHWDGAAWSISSIPEPDSSPILSGVAAAPGTPAWAVGDYIPPGIGHFQTLTEQWDGSTWSVVPSPNVGGTSQPNVLQDVDVLGDGTALAVGYYSAPNQPIFQTLAQEICPG